MTQQNETEQQGATAPGQQGATAPGQQGATAPGQQGATAGPPAMPPQPSSASQLASASQPGSATTPATLTSRPSLFGYEALPEAYLAPPQPGQPRYGAPAHGGSGRPFPGRPGYGQPAGEQDGYGRPAPARPGLAAAARRDPTLAMEWQRFAAQAIDWFIIFVVSVIAFWSQLSVYFHEIQAIRGRYPDFNSPAADAAVNSILRNPANQHALLFWFLGMFGIALVYYWVQHAAWGATIGKRALGMRVVRAADRSRIGVLAAGIRTVAFLIGPAIFLLLLYPLNFVGGVLWAADAGLPLLDSRAQSLHDKLAGTVVVRQAALDDQARRSR